MKQKVFKELSERVIEATKEAIMNEIELNELDFIRDFDDFVSKNFTFMKFLNELALRVFEIEIVFDYNNKECLTTLQEFVEYIGDCYTLYEGDENIFQLASTPFDSEQQMKDYLGYISRRIKSIRKKVAA